MAPPRPRPASRVPVYAIVLLIAATGLAYCSFTRYPPLDEPDFSPANPRVQTVKIMPALRELHRDLKLGKGR